MEGTRGVVISGARPVVSAAIAFALEESSPFKGTAEAIGRPDVLILDLVVDGASVVDHLSDTIRVLGILPHGRQGVPLLRELLHPARLVALVTEQDGLAEILVGVHEIQSGRPYASSSGLSLLMAAAASALATRIRPLDGLTERERDVLRAVIDGLTVPAIGRRLDISPKTVEAHVTRIYRKLGVASREEAVVLAVTEELV